jgi:PAS domain S-box-containing protein
MDEWGAYILNDHGQVDYIVGMISDITDRKLAEEKLQRSEERFRKIFHASPIAISLTTLDEGFLLDANQAYWEITGLQPDTIGQNAFELDLWNRLEDRQSLVDELKTKFSTVYLNDGFLNKSGELQHVVSYYELIHIDGRDCILSMFSDITLQRKLEQERERLILQLGEQNKELESKNTELERFTYTVSHDLKSPLVTIRGFLGYLEKDIQAGRQDNISTDIGRISGAVEKMQALLDDLLELSRVGRMMNKPETISSNDVVREALELVDGQLKARNVNITVQPDLPVIHGDRARVIEVFQNLLDNASKYMGAQPHPIIEIGHQNYEDGMSIFYVRDNGIGIAPVYHENIFGLFNKLDPHSEGTGVGLALVKRIIELHGGKIWVESEIGKGATFYFTLAPAPARH